MKWFIVLCLLSTSVLACDKGCEPYAKGLCACEGTPEASVSVKPSDEKPPDDKLPSYEREGVKALTPPSLVTEDAKLDQEKADADKQGKKAAGIKIQEDE